MVQFDKALEYLLFSFRWKMTLSNFYGINFRAEFHGVVLSLGKIHRDGKQMMKGGSGQPSLKRMKQRVGVKPSLADCLDGLMLLHEMHHSEYGTNLPLEIFQYFLSFYLL